MNKIGRKPILIEFLVKFSAITASSLAAATGEILKKESAQLGEFLFADSWGRIDIESRRLFMIVGQLGGFVDDVLLSYACEQAAVLKEDWLVAFEETRFGDIHYYGARLELVLDEGARNFVLGRYILLDQPTQKLIDSAAKQCHTNYVRYLSAQKSVVTDRIEKAFVHPLAKAAKIAGTKGDILRAREYFDQAIIADPNNAFLCDRYAWFLMAKIKDLDAAERIADRALTLLGSDEEINFTKGMIHARQADVVRADHYLGLAREYGKPRHLTQFQMAHARYEFAKRNRDLIDANLHDSIVAILEGAIIGEPKDRHHLRHNQEIASLRGKVRSTFKGLI